jgi:hypothetical protein
MKYIIKDSFDNHCFEDKTFKDYESGWEFLYNKYPVIYYDDGSQDDQDDELNEYFVVKY